MGMDLEWPGPGLGHRSRVGGAWIQSRWGIDPESLEPGSRVGGAWIHSRVRVPRVAVLAALAQAR